MTRFNGRNPDRALTSLPQSSILRVPPDQAVTDLRAWLTAGCRGPMTMNDTEKMRDVIEKVVTEQFLNLRIVEVNVKPETNDDGDLNYWVRVIFDAKAKWPETRIRVGLTRHIRAEMEEKGIDGFPITTFVADSEYGSTKAETV